MRINKLLARKYREEGEGGEGTGAPAASDFASILPPEYKDNPALKDYKDIGGLIKSHLNLQTMVGGSLKIPTDDNPESWNQLYDKLGRPKTADEYQFDLGEELKDAQLDPELTKWGKELFHKYGLTAKQANGVMKDYVQREMQVNEGKQSRDDMLDEYEDALREQLGGKFDESIQLATRARDMFLDEETRQFLDESGLGSHPGLVNTFIKIGNLLKEDKAFSDGAANSGFAAGPSEARAEIGRLNSDQEFMAAYLNKDNPGHVAAVERRQRLYKVAYPGKINN